MKGSKALFDRDAQIDMTIKEIVDIVKKKHIEKDRRGQWFANSQLNNLRQLLERKGYKTARIYQVGRIERKGNRWEIARNEALLEILDLLGSKNNNLDVTICSYILGSLNLIIDETFKKEV